MLLYLILAKDLIVEGEGFMPSEYICPAGARTIGYGRNLDTKPLSAKEIVDCKINRLGELSIDRNKAEDWVKADILKIYEKIKSEPYFTGIGDARKAVVIDLIYNMGEGTFSKFKRFKKALIDRDFQKASDELMLGEDGKSPSKYALQTKTRAVRNSKIILTGEIVAK